MKPQIVTDLSGINAANLGVAHSRLIKGASWKKQRVVVIMPADDVIPAKVVLSWLNLAYAPNNGVVRWLAQGMEVGDAYSSAISQIISHPILKDWEYILTVEHDNMPPSDGVIRLLERMEMHPELSAIGGVYFTKGYNGVAQIWGDKQDTNINFRPQLPDPNGGLKECWGTGMGFTLFRLAMFKDKKLRNPWFVTQKKDGIATQDLYFWADAAPKGYRCAIDCSVKVGHYDLKGDFGPPDTIW